MMNNRKGLTTAFALVLAAAGSVALAQGQGQQMPMGQGMMGQGMNCPMMGSGMMTSQGMGSGGMMGSGDMMGMMGDRDTAAMTEERLTKLKAELAITDAQLVAWNRYADAAKAQATAMRESHHKVMVAMRSGPAPARMDAHIAAMEGMSKGLKELKPATEALYQVLTPEQKQKADASLGLGCCAM